MRSGKQKRRGGLQGLENELDAPLLIRVKGHQRVELTSYGQSFVPLASQWTVLWKHTRRQKAAEETRVLTIARIDSVNNYTLVRLFNEHVDRHPNIKLRVHTYHSSEIHGLVQNRMADVGFVFSRVNYPNVISRPVYRELMYLVCRRDGPERHPAVTVSTGSTLQRFRNAPNRWAVVPMSVIHQMNHKSELTHYNLNTPPPPRICHEIKNRYPTEGQQQAIDVFHRELERFIAENPDICTFEDWMLGDERSREKGS